MHFRRKRRKSLTSGTFSNRCGKIGYRSDRAAARALAECEEKRGVALRSYFCGRCMSYHLTSQPYLGGEKSEISG